MCKKTKFLSNRRGLIKNCAYSLHYSVKITYCTQFNTIIIMRQRKMSINTQQQLKKISNFAAINKKYIY